MSGWKTAVSGLCRAVLVLVSGAPVCCSMLSNTLDAMGYRMTLRSLGWAPRDRRCANYIPALLALTTPCSARRVCAALLAALKARLDSPIRAGDGAGAGRGFRLGVAAISGELTSSALGEVWPPRCSLIALATGATRRVVVVAVLA